MAIGDVYQVERPGCEDIHYLDTGMYDTAQYGSVYIVDAERPAIVDTGIGTNHEYVLDALETVGIARDELELILPTHVHLDHAGGAGFIAEACPNAEVRTHETGVPHLVDPAALWAGTKRAVGEQLRFYTKPEPVPEDRISGLTDGDVVDLGDSELAVHDAPGHAAHQVVLFDPEAAALFTADAAGIYVQERDEVVPTSPPPGFDLERCLDDVEMQRELKPETLLYGHYGPAPAGDRLAEYATVIEQWVADIEAKREELGDDEAVADHFATENDLSEVWGSFKVEAETKMNVRGVLHYLDERE